MRLRNKSKRPRDTGNQNSPGSCVYLLSALELTHSANEHIACASLCVCVGLGVQAESVEDAGEETDVVTHLHAVPKLHQSRQVP